MRGSRSLMLARRGSKFWRPQLRIVTKSNSTIHFPLKRLEHPSNLIKVNRKHSGAPQQRTKNQILSPKKPLSKSIPHSKNLPRRPLSRNRQIKVPQNQIPEMALPTSPSELGAATASSSSMRPPWHVHKLLSTQYSRRTRSCPSMLTRYLKNRRAYPVGRTTSTSSSD